MSYLLGQEQLHDCPTCGEEIDRAEELWLKYGENVWKRLRERGEKHIPDTAPSEREWVQGGVMLTWQWFVKDDAVMPPLGGCRAARPGTTAQRMQ